MGLDEIREGEAERGVGEGEVVAKISAITSSVAVVAVAVEGVIEGEYLSIVTPK